MKMRLGWIAVAAALAATAACAGEFSKQAIGTPGNWAGTIAGAVLDGTLYTVEAGGKLYATDPSDGSWTPLGGADFANTVFLFAVGDSLASIEKDGTLYLIDPADGSWKQSGPSGGWANTLAGAVLAGTLYTVESSGTLYATDPAAGTWRKVGNPDFAATKFLFAADNQLVSIESSGNLYFIDPADGSWKQVGETGAWADVLAGTAIGRTLHTAEADGSLCATDVAMGTRVAAASGFAGTRFLFGIRGSFAGSTRRAISSDMARARPPWTRRE